MKPQAKQFYIGSDMSDGCDDDEGRGVAVTAHTDGTLTIDAPNWAGWSGYTVLAVLDTQERAIECAKKIESDPVSELEKLNYETGNWFRADK